METSLPVCSSVNSSYDISSPKAFVGDPFMGVSMSSFGANVDYNNVSTIPHYQGKPTCVIMSVQKPCVSVYCCTQRLYIADNVVCRSSVFCKYYQSIFLYVSLATNG